MAVHSVRKLFVKCINNLALQCCYLGIWLVKSPVPIITVTVLVLTNLTCSNVRKVWPELKWPFEQRREEVAMVVVHYTVVEFIHIFYTQLHIIRSNSDEDHTRALNAGINDPPKEWKWPRGHPHQTWLRTVENDLKHQNLGLWSARHRAYDRDQWRDIVETATLLQWHATKRWWWWNIYTDERCIKLLAQCRLIAVTCVVRWLDCCFEWFIPIMYV